MVNVCACVAWVGNHDQHHNCCQRKRCSSLYPENDEISRLLARTGALRLQPLKTNPCLFLPSEPTDHEFWIFLEIEANAS